MCKVGTCTDKYAGCRAAADDVVLPETVTIQPPAAVRPLTAWDCRLALAAFEKGGVD